MKEETKMKPLNSKYFTIAVYAIAVIAFTVVFLLFGLYFGQFTLLVGDMLGKIASIFYAIAFALILLPFVKLFDKLYGKLICRKKEHPFLVSLFSITTVYLLLLSVIFVSIRFLIPAISNNFQELYASITGLFTEYSAKLSTDSPEFQAWLASFSESNSKLISDIIQSLQSYVQNALLNTENASVIASKLISFASGLISQLADIFLGLIISIYLLASRRFLSAICGKIVVAVFPEKFALKFVIFFKRLYTDFCAFSSARITFSFVVSTVVFVFSWIFRIPLFSVFVILLFFFQLFPAIGTVFGVVIASLIVVLLAPIKALIFIPALIAIEVLVSRLFMPLFMQKKLRPSYGLSTVLVIIGFALFGPIGGFLAVPLYATLNVEVRSFLAHRLAKKNMPIAGDIYAEHDLEDVLRIAKENADKANQKNADTGSDGSSGTTDTTV